MSKVAWIITDNNITVRFDNQTHIVAKTDALADRLIGALKANKLDLIPELVSAAKRIEKYSEGNFSVKEGQIFVDGVLAPSVLGSKILKFSNEGLPFKPLIEFAKKLQLNPSFRAVNELFQFLEKNDHPITESGNFIAYKKVRANFKDVHTGTFDNSVGEVVQMPRNQVNEDANQTCSYGLHVANYDYAANFYAGGVMLEVEVDPSDVVAVPVDYQNSKMRVCKYKVLGVVDRQFDPKESLRYDLKPDLSEDCEDCDGCCDQDTCDSSSCHQEDEYPYEDEVDESY